MDEKPEFSDEASLSPDANSIGKGVAIWIVLLIVVGVVLIVVATASPVNRLGGGVPFALLMLQPGLWQLLFVIPAVVLLRRQKKFESAKGVLICASALFILNAICSGSIFLGSR